METVYDGRIRQVKEQFKDSRATADLTVLRTGGATEWGTRTSQSGPKGPGSSRGDGRGWMTFIREQRSTEYLLPSKWHKAPAWTVEK